MKPFDLEKAKAGAAVMTGSGQQARILCYDRQVEKFPLVVLVSLDGEESLEIYTAEGTHNPEHETGWDLCMAPVKRSGWVNVHRPPVGPMGVGRIYESKQEALDVAGHYPLVVATIMIEWEE